MTNLNIGILFLQETALSCFATFANIIMIDWD